MNGIINLPQDLLSNPGEASEQIIFHDYTATTGAFKGRSILNSNAISMVISGEKTMHFAEKTVHIKDDEFHFLSSGNCLASVDLSGKTMFRSILIFFDTRILTDFYIKYASLIQSHKDKKNFSKEPYIAFKKDDVTLNYIHSLSLLLQRGKNISREMGLLKFEELLLHLLEKYPETLLSFQASQSKDLNDLAIRKAVETNVVNNVTLEELAFLCNISVSTFQRRFMKIYGTSPTKWILQRRMDMAKQLLLHHHEKPSEVYYKVGYENHSSFTQSFKQTFGLTPKEFQLQH